jgi:hypothetical protein
MAVSFRILATGLVARKGVPLKDLLQRQRWILILIRRFG